MISRKDIENLAELSRLTLSEEEVVRLEQELPAILQYVSHIEKAAGAEPMVPPVHTVMREDEVGMTVGGTPESLLAAAPRREGDYFVVRKILHKE